MIYHSILYTTATDCLPIFATCTRERVPLRLGRTLARTVHVHARVAPVSRTDWLVPVRVPVSPCVRPHASVSAAGPTDVVHLFMSAFCPTMEVTRNKEVCVSADIPELGVSSGVRGDNSSIRERSSPFQGRPSPGFATCSPLPSCKGWLSSLGSHLPARRERGFRHRNLGRAAELRWVILFPRYLDTIPAFFQIWGNAVELPRRHEGLVDTGLKQAASPTGNGFVGIILTRR